MWQVMGDAGGADVMLAFGKTLRRMLPESLPESVVRT
jgi:hypothetical protein